jgi:AcrR family transcriptional regulator
MDKPYHHGNLENALIENGIKLLSLEGLENFSLRRVAKISGVSNAAPYKHFASKEDLIDAMQLYVEEVFVERLLASVENPAPNEERLVLLAQAYLRFFRENPHYFEFLTMRTNVNIDLNSQNSPDNYRPFEIFKRIAYEEMDRWGTPSESRQKMLIGMWSVVQGLTSLAIMRGVRYSGDWNELLHTILKQNY